MLLVLETKSEDDPLQNTSQKEIRLGYFWKRTGKTISPLYHFYSFVQGATLSMNFRHNGSDFHVT